jgi:Short C-terminal domain
MGLCHVDAPPVYQKPPISQSTTVIMQQLTPHGQNLINLGYPSSSGSQNSTRYAFFPQARRLAVQRDGQVTVFDTLDHQIGGVSQQQGGGSSLTFTSQYGTLSTLSLPLVSGPGLQPGNSTNFAAPPAPVYSSAPSGNTPPPSGDLVTLLEKLGQLRDAGILTHEEFAAKKTDLLNRL